eukprot:TRINITY_DN2027_c0_g1_i1.p1 TRINITY_DN2027_c0_g1~~TRINITY_DN2027_c0_g1_i1.p1  ORF type:complete len:297 (-),score=91.25 TRINITY_DN2027_c0_g1_i1:154-1044(-)
MFSRVASSTSAILRGASRSGALPRLTAATRPLLRPFSSVAVPAAPSKDEEETAPQKKGVLEEYGVIPIAGFVFAWAISTEVVLMDAELILAFMELAMFGTILNAAREPAAAYLKKYNDEETAIVVESQEDNRLALESEITMQRKFANLTDLVTRVQHYRADLAQQALEAKVRRSKAHRNKAVQERLSRVAAFEQDLQTKRSQLNVAVAQEVLSSAVTKKITPQVQASINGWLIEHLSSGAQAPLDKINDFVNKEVAAARAEAAKGVPADVKSKFAEHFEDLSRQEQFFKSLVERAD